MVLPLSLEGQGLYHSQGSSAGCLGLARLLPHLTGVEEMVGTQVLLAQVTRRIVERKEDKQQSRGRAALPQARPERWPLSPGSNVLRLALARRPSPLLSSAPGSWAAGLGLPVGQTDKVQEAPGCGGGGVGQLAGGFGVGEWQQGDILAGPAVAGEGAPLAMGVKASGLWVDFRAFSWAGSSSSRGWSSSFRCWEGGGHSAWLPAPAQGIGVGGRGACAVGTPGPGQDGAHGGSGQCPGPAEVWRGWYLELGGPLLWLLEGVELLLRQELRPRVDRELARVLHVGCGAPAPVHGGPQ